MENSISRDFESSNSIDTLQFFWIAEFKDQTYIEQYENEQEHRFKEVQDKINELKYFCLYNKEYMYNRFTVDLEKGYIYFNNGYLIGNQEIQTEKRNIRLIFFRRHKIILSEKLKEDKHTIHYYLGFQYNDKLGNNHKIVLNIDEEGNWVLES